jgi:hypothetical protein
MVSVAASTPIYSDYKQLPFYKKVGQTGLAYLFASWSHHQEDREYLREMIQFMERGKQNQNILRPLYDFAFAKFGTTFSRHEKNRREVASEKLKRKREEELKAEIKAAESLDYNTETEFTNDQEKIKFFLRKAKDSKEDSDQKRKMLVVD